jgi:hypothetical protein
VILGDPSVFTILPSLRKSLFANFCLLIFGFKRKGLLGPLLLMLIVTSVTPQDAKQVSMNKSAYAEKAVEFPTDQVGIRYISNNRRDPFLNPLRLRKKSKKDHEEMARSLPPPGIAGTCIDDLSFEGTSLRDDRRLAIIRSADNRAHFLEEGARLFDGYLKTIQTDSIILIRETRLRSGKILAQVVTKRLRKP